MQTVTITDAPTIVNIEALDADLRTELGVVYLGLSTGGVDGFRLHLADGATGEQAAAAALLVSVHNPSNLTPAQQQRRERETAYAALAEQVGALDLSQPLDAAAADVVLRFHALRWLLGH